MSGREKRGIVHADFYAGNSGSSLNELDIKNGDLAGFDVFDNFGQRAFILAYNNELSSQKNYMDEGFSPDKEKISLLFQKGNAFIPDQDIDKEWWDFVPYEEAIKLREPEGISDNSNYFSRLSLNAGFLHKLRPNYSRVNKGESFQVIGAYTGKENIIHGLNREMSEPAGDGLLKGMEYYGAMIYFSGLENASSSDKSTKELSDKLNSLFP